METLVLGWMPRAGLLLLLLLLCFGPETTGTIDPKSLKVIVDYVNLHGGVPELQYAFAVSLHHDVCKNPWPELNNSLPIAELGQMKSTLSHVGGLYNPDHGNIVAARPKKEFTLRENYTEHSEWRLLHGPNNPVAQLKNRTYGQNSCLIFFTYNSPCSRRCLSRAGPYNIVRMTSDAFSAIVNNQKAFVFQKIFDYDMENVTRRDLLDAWHRLRDVTLLRCDNNGCHNCTGRDRRNRPNPCLAGKRWTKEPGQEPRGARSATGLPRCARVPGTLTNRCTSQLGTKLPSRTPFLCPCTLI